MSARGADRLADRLHHAGGEVDVDEARLVAVEGGVGSCRIELHRVEALLDIFQRAVGGEVGIVVDVDGRRPRPGTTLPDVRIEIGVGAQRLMHLAAEQLVDRLVRFLADDVPARHFQRREAAHHRNVRPLGEAGGIAAAEEDLDVVRIVADEIALGADPRSSAR